ncbi:factor activating pos9 [Saitozyma podzolica]|uniref:Factor activating pos9 n=1 Tax=Saitozyma podzolica TaxID=1890683 RepID=A0A427YTG8_9TREE|nr:factor activating pos9 [Saitozyma podzolica]
MTTHHPRQFPVILITGTPGTGKTLHATLLTSLLADSPTPLTHIDIGQLVKTRGFHEGFDEEWQSYTVDEDRLLDYLEEVLNPEEAPAGTGFVIDHHDPSLFPERWIDLAVCLTADNGVLHERLTAR